MIDRITWLGMLAKLGTPADPVKALQAMEAYLPFIDDMPNAAFTLPSLQHVAMSPKRLHIPDLSEVKAPLLAWWRDNKPSRPALPSPTFRPEASRHAPTAEERAHVARQIAELTAGLGGTHRDVVVPIRSTPIAPAVLAEMRAKLKNGGS